MNALVAFAFVAVGLLHLVPAAGVLGAERLHALYGVTIADPDLLLMLRHRAALFGIVGALLLAAAWRREWRTPAAAVGLASMASYLVLAWPLSAHGAPIVRVFWADVAGTVLLGLALLLARRRGPAPGLDRPG